MTAKEMFEKLGYEKLSKNYYTKDKTENTWFAIYIDIKTKTIEKLIVSNNYERVVKEYTFDEIKAINKHIEELEME